MTPPLVVNPRNASYLSRTPYLTVQEYLNAPTAVDTTQLIPGGTTQQNQQALLDVIARASSMADSLCYQVLAATSEVETKQVRIRSDGYVAIKTKYWPILEVDALSLGPRPDMLTALTTTDGAIMWIQDPVVFAPAWSSGTTTSPNFATPPPPLFIGDRVFAQITYVCGWPNTLLTTTAASGQAQLTVTSPLGIYGTPNGTPLTIYDGPLTESVVVQSVNGNTLTLASNLLNTHTGTAAAPISVSALPPAVKEAVICLTSFTIKVRGAEAVVMASVAGPPRHTTPLEAGGMEDLGIAAELLAPYRRVA